MNIIRHILIFILLSLLTLGLSGCNTYEIDKPVGYAYNYSLDSEYEGYNEYKYSTQLLFNKNGTFERNIHKSYIKNNNYNEHNRFEHGRFNVIKYINNVENTNKYSWVSNYIEISDIDFIYQINTYDHIIYELLISDNHAYLKENILNEDRVIILDSYNIPNISHNIFSVNSIYTLTSLTIDGVKLPVVNNNFIYLYDHNSIYIDSNIINVSLYDFNISNNKLIIDIIDTKYNIYLSNNNTKINIRYIDGVHEKFETYELYKGIFTLERFKLFNL